jgi:hypothetical protein
MDRLFGPDLWTGSRVLQAGSPGKRRSGKRSGRASAASGWQRPASGRTNFSDLPQSWYSAAFLPSLPLSSLLPGLRRSTMARQAATVLTENSTRRGIHLVSSRNLNETPARLHPVLVEARPMRDSFLHSRMVLVGLVAVTLPVTWGLHELIQLIHF